MAQCTSRLSVMHTKTTFFRRLTRLLTGSLATLCLLVPGVRTVADAFTLPEQLIGVTQGFLEFTVEDYLATTQTAGRYEIQVNPLDPRLRMPLCSQQLDASLESPAQPLGRVTVRVRCDGAAPWTVFFGDAEEDAMDLAVPGFLARSAEQDLVFPTPQPARAGAGRSGSA